MSLIICNCLKTTFGSKQLTCNFLKNINGVL